MPKDDGKKAFDAAKSAVNTYAKDPSDKNADKVQSAWETVKELQTAAIWQQHSEFWLRSNPDPEDDLKINKH